MRTTRNSAFLMKTGRKRDLKMVFFDPVFFRISTNAKLDVGMKVKRLEVG